MIRLFDDDITVNNKQVLKRLYLVLSLSLGLAIMLSVLIILLRNKIGTTLALVLGIILSSLGLIIFIEALFAGVLPIKKRERLVLRLLRNEARQISGIVSGFDNKIEYHHGEPFYKLSVLSNNITLELYFWATSEAQIPQIDQSINVSLSENIIMGYEVL